MARRRRLGWLLYALLCLAWVCAAESASRDVDGRVRANERSAIEVAELLCAPEAKRLCARGGAAPAAEAGAGGTIGCLLRLSATDDAAAQSISGGCQKVLETTRLQLLAQSLPDVRVAAACAEPVRTGVCKNALRVAGSSPGSQRLKLMRCLRSPHVRAGLPEGCKREVTRVMIEEARNISLDVQLYHSCAEELDSPPCNAVSGGSGARRACLLMSQYYAAHHLEAEAHNISIGPMSRGCSRALSTATIEASDDVRFHPTIIDNCAAERARFCADLPPGDGRVISCLVRHRTHTDTSPACRLQLYAHEKRVMADFRLDPVLVRACSTDILVYCPNETLGRGAVIGCLIRQEMSLSSEACRHEVHRLGQAATGDVTLNRPLFEACAAALLPPSGICSKVEPGEGRALECLKQARHATRSTRSIGTTWNATVQAMGVLTAQCIVQIDSLALLQARDVHYNRPIVRACAAEMSNPAICGGIASHGKGEVLHCLETKRLDADFSPGCEAEARLRANAPDLASTTSDGHVACGFDGPVTKDFIRRSASIDTLVALKSVCRADLEQLCDNDLASKVVQVLSSSGLSREQIGESKREIARQVSAAQTAAEVEAAEFSNPGRSTQVIRSLTISPATFTNASAVATIMAAEVAPRLTCLRRRAREIANPLCAERVRGYALAASENALANAPLIAACRDDIQTFCAKVKPGGGRLLQCLETVALSTPYRDDHSTTTTHPAAPATAPDSLVKDRHLSAQCRERLLEQFRQELSDPSTSFGLQTDCGAELVAFCPVIPAANQANASIGVGQSSATHSGGLVGLDCLREHIRAFGFRPKCASRVASLTRTQMSDSRLMMIGGQLASCQKEAERLCPNQTHAASSVPISRRYTGLHECLQAKHDQLPPGLCRTKIRSSLRVLAFFPTANTPMMKACKEQFLSFCGTGGGADVLDDASLLTCLRESRDSFTGACRQKTFAVERMAHAEMDFNAEVSETCALELRTRCRGVDSKQQMACLEMLPFKSHECAELVISYRSRETSSLELMSRVADPCKEDFELLCASAKALQHPGASIQCLKDSRGSIRSPTCKAAVIDLMASASKDARYNALLQLQCGVDLLACTNAGVLPGEGRLLGCLKSKIKQLQPPCREQIDKVVAAENEDLRFNHAVQSHCETELHLYCANIKSQDALGCLELHLSRPDFGLSCADAVKTSIKLSLLDYRLHPKVRDACSASISRLCGGIRPGDATVLGCLLSHETRGNLTATSCAKAIRAAARSAFLTYEPGQGMTQVCDEDILSLCVAPSASAGAVAARFNLTDSWNTSSFVRSPAPREAPPLFQLAATLIGHTASDSFISASVDADRNSILDGSEIWPCLSHAAHMATGEEGLDPFPLVQESRKSLGHDTGAKSIMKTPLPSGSQPHFKSDVCRSLVRRISVDPSLSPAEAEARARELSAALAESSSKHAEILKRHKAELDAVREQHGAAIRSETEAQRVKQEAERVQRVAEIIEMQRQMNARADELASLREALRHEEAMRRRAEKLHEEASRALLSVAREATPSNGDGHGGRLTFILVLLFCGGGLLGALHRWKSSNDPTLKGYTVLTVVKDG